mgnify:CR=1 FL=1
MEIATVRVCEAAHGFAQPEPEDRTILSSSLRARGEVWGEQ